MPKWPASFNPKKIHPKKIIIALPHLRLRMKEETSTRGRELGKHGA
jgi:hypothetical protein